MTTATKQNDLHYSNEEITRFQTQDQARIFFNSTPSIQKEFGRVEVFLAFWKAAKGGRVNICGRTS